MRYPGPFMVSALSLYCFLLFIMFHPVETIDSFLQVRKLKLYVIKFAEACLSNTQQY